MSTPRPSAGGYPSADDLERAARFMRELDASPNARAGFELARREQDVDSAAHRARASEAEAQRAQFLAQAERVRAEEQRRTLEARRAGERDLMDYKLQRERENLAEQDRLARRRDDDRRRRDLEDERVKAAIRAKAEAQIEEARSRGAEQRALLERQTAAARAEAEAAGRIREARENEDVHTRAVSLRAAEDRTTRLQQLEAGARLAAGQLGAFVLDRPRVTATVLALSALATGVFAAREGARVAAALARRRLLTPPLVRETSRSLGHFSLRRRAARFASLMASMLDLGRAGARTWGGEGVVGGPRVEGGGARGAGDGSGRGVGGGGVPVAAPFGGARLAGIGLPALHAGGGEGLAPRGGPFPFCVSSDLDTGGAVGGSGGLLGWLRDDESDVLGAGGVVLEPSLARRVQALASSIRRTRAHGGALRNALFYGPPGTGKTLVARRLARASGLDFAVMSGGDVGPLGRQASPELHRLLDWGQRSPRGLLLFIDEAEAFLGSRARAGLSEDQRNALNALLFRTGEPSRHLVLVLATNRPADLDSAVTDRVDEALCFDLPGRGARARLLRLYLLRLLEGEGTGGGGVRAMAGAVLRRLGLDLGPGLGWSAPPQLRVAADVDAAYVDSVAARTRGFSARAISKLVASLGAAAFASAEEGAATGGPALSRALIEEVLAAKLVEHRARVAGFHMLGAGAEAGGASALEAADDEAEEGAEDAPR